MSLILLTFLLSIVVACNSSQFIYTEIDKRIDLVVNIQSLSKKIYDNFNADKLEIDEYDKSSVKDAKDFYYKVDGNSLKSYGSNKDDDYNDDDGFYEKTGLSNNCNNKFCTMLKFLLVTINILYICIYVNNIYKYYILLLKIIVYSLVKQLDLVFQR